MIYLEVGSNEEGQRLDRFLRKYLASAPLSVIYKIIRKDLKVNGSKKPENYLINKGDELILYMSEADFAKYSAKSPRKRAKRQFEIVYEDENLLIVNKPFGLLTHGDSREKKNHLANQVLDYLIEQGDYNPRKEVTFAPAPANRLDRNTTGLVMFGKTAPALRELNKLIRLGEEERSIGKYYLTVVAGRLDKTINLSDAMVKDREQNKVKIIDAGDAPKTKIMKTIATPLCHSRVKGDGTSADYTLVEAEILTGRTHQIRAQLAGAGYPLIGDPKYGNRKVNYYCKSSLGLNTQMLHAWKLRFGNLEDGVLSYMKGREITAIPPKDFLEAASSLGLDIEKYI